MWNKKAKVKRSSNHFDTLISSKTSVMGDIHFSGGLHIDGKVKGAIQAEENGEAVVRISDVGEVDGNVIAPHIIVNGTVHGDVYASQHIELASEASINGNVYYHLIEMAMGAEVNGKLVHHKDSSTPIYQAGEVNTAASVKQAENKVADPKPPESKPKVQPVKEPGAARVTPLEAGNSEKGAAKTAQKAQ